VERGYKTVFTVIGHCQKKDSWKAGDWLDGHGPQVNILLSGDIITFPPLFLAINFSNLYINIYYF